MSSAPSVLDAAAVDAQDACPVCPHPVAAHDPISLRFCRATEERHDGSAPVMSATRGCVCPSA